MKVKLTIRILRGVVAASEMDPNRFADNSYYWKTELGRLEKRNYSLDEVFHTDIHDAYEPAFFRYLGVWMGQRRAQEIKTDEKVAHVCKSFLDDLDILLENLRNRN